MNQGVVISPVRPVPRTGFARDDADTRLAPPRERPVILILVGWYPPAYLAGGPTRSVPRIVERLADEFAFLVITGDRDLGAKNRLAGIASDQWISGSDARYLYLSPRHRRLGGLLTSLRRAPHDALYLNSLFSLEFSLIPLALRKLGLVPRQGLILAPRGELHASALALKGTRKRLVLWLVGALHLLDDAIWHVATAKEKDAVIKHFGARAQVLIARDIPLQPGPAIQDPSKDAGALELAYLSRISPMKNLKFAISVLKTVRGRVNFNVYGPIEDPHYWAECRRLASELPPNITMNHLGHVEPDRITEVLARHHVFFLPTQGESFGHAITEALIAGCPVLISDQTPWHDLSARHAGWDFPLSRPDLFAQAIDECVAMTGPELAIWRAGARQLAFEIADYPALDAAHQAVFSAAVSALKTAVRIRG